MQMQIFLFVILQNMKVAFLIMNTMVYVSKFSKIW